MPTLLELVARALAALGLFASAGFLGWRLAWHLVGRRDPLLRSAAVLVSSAWILTAVFHVLRPLGLFRLVPGLAVLAALALAGALVDRSRLRSELAHEGRLIRRFSALVRHSPYRGALSLFGVFALVVVARALLMPPLGWDTLTYHGLRAALWVQTGQATFDAGPGTWEIYRHYFAGSEVLFAWALLPFRSDLVCGFTQALQWVGVFVAVWSFARACGVREPYGSSSAAAFLFVPTFFLSVGSGYVEPALLLGLVTGKSAALCAFVRRRAGLVLLCALALGLGIGVKLPGAPVAAVSACVALVALLRLVVPAPRKLALLALGVALLVVPVLPWMLLALRETGHPLSPMPVTLGGFRLGVANAAMAWYQDRPGVKLLGFPAEWAALREIFAPLGTMREGLGILTALPLVVFPVGLGVLALRRPAAGLLAVLTALAVAVFFYSRDLVVTRILWATSSSRFLLPLVALAIPVSLAWAPLAPRLARVYRRVLLACAVYGALVHLRMGWGKREVEDLAMVVVAIGASALVLDCAWRRLGPRTAGAAGVALGVLLLVGLQKHAWSARTDYMNESFHLHKHQKYWARPAELVDEPGRRHVIALTSGPSQNADQWFSYYFLGRRLQNRVVYVPPTRDGSLVSFRPEGALEAAADKDAWLERLSARGVTEVMSFGPRSLELAWMDATPERFERLAGTPKWGFYRFR